MKCLGCGAISERDEGACANIAFIMFSLLFAGELPVVFDQRQYRD